MNEMSGHCFIAGCDRPDPHAHDLPELLRERDARIELLEDVVKQHEEVHANDVAEWNSLNAQARRTLHRAFVHNDAIEWPVACEEFGCVPPTPPSADSGHCSEYPDCDLPDPHAHPPPAEKGEKWPSCDTCEKPAPDPAPGAESGSK